MGAEDFPFLDRQMALSAVADRCVLLMVIPMGWGLVGVWWGQVTLMAGRGLTLPWRYWAVWPEA